jgi:hypothetical protein
VLGAGEIGTPRASGLEPADPSELGRIVAKRETPSMAAFRFGPLESGTSRALNSKGGMIPSKKSGSVTVQGV